jgi:aspartyl-tRNA(Asn)/glutamyl-tRNA(Gln) amidotransferase subunit C
MEKQDIQRLALLARISVTDAEAESFAKDITSILGYVSDIEKITGNMEGEKKVGEIHNVFREDKNPHAPGIYTEDLLNNAPSRSGDYVKVKKILGEKK